jgi:predicted HTH transcriptional regulator
MATTVDQINLWLQVPRETQILEFKEAKNQFDDEKLYRYCVAIANEGGGHFVLGVTDAPPRTVVGSAAYPNVIKIAEHIFQKVGFRVEVEEVMHPNGRVVVFEIPPRPRGTAYAFEGAYLMRSGASLTPMSEDRLRKIFAEGKPDWLEEVSKSGLETQAVIDLLDTQTFFDLLKLPYPTNRDAVIEKLIQERLVDKVDGSYSIRRIAAILLAKKLNDFPDVGRKAPRVVVYNGISKLETRLDQTGERGYAVGFQGLAKFIMDQLPQNEVIEGALRKEYKLLPEEVIREIVANALIHQDFTIGGASVMVEIYSNRLEVSNPGEPIVPVQRFIDGYQSRNERLANLMRRMRICEEKGSGIDRVVRASEIFQLPAPDFKASQGRTYVTVYGPKPLDDMDKDDRVRACYQHCVLKWVVSERMTNQSLRERFNLPDTKTAIASQIISATIDAKLIKSDESVGISRKLARYLPFWA